MKSCRRQNRKLNNAGMSLVEVVVAIFILAVVTTTILSVFVFTIRLNARSRTRQQTTAAAQAVMENFKAYSVQELCEQFNGIHEIINDEVDPPIVNVKRFSVSGTAETAIATQTTQIVRLLDSVSALPGTSSTPIVLPQNNAAAIKDMLESRDDINFQVRNMEYQNEHYDVEIQLRRHEGSHASDMQTLLYENRTEENFAAYVADRDMDAKALEKIADKVAEEWTARENASLVPGATPAPAHSKEEVDFRKINITKRELTATVSQDGDDYVVKVGCKYWYKVNGFSYVDASGVTQTFDIPETEYVYMMDTSEVTKEIFRKPMATGSSMNLTLYYFPAYHDVGSLHLDEMAAVSIAKDSIVIDNMLTVPLGGDRPEVKCYLYKQRNFALNDNRIRTFDMQYGNALELTLGDNVFIYDDNLDTVLGGRAEDTYTYPNANIYPSQKRENRYRGISYMAEAVNVPGPGVTPAPVSDKTVETIRLMYKITVLVYEQGELDKGAEDRAAALTTLEGTIIE